MSGLIQAKLRELRDMLADLKTRVRVALAGELSGAVAAAVRDVVAFVVAGRTIEPPRPTSPSYGPAIRAVIATLAATADLLTVTDALGDGAARFDGL